MEIKKNINEYRKLNVLGGIEILNAKNCTVNFPFHKHETYNVSLILDNVFKTDLKDKSFLAPQNALAITNPDEFHATPCDRTIGNSFVTFYIPKSIISELSGDENLIIENRVIHNLSLFNELLSLSKNPHLDSINAEKRIINALKLLLINSNSNTNEELNHSSIKAFIKEIIAETESFSLDLIDSKYGINKYKFIRLFKDEIGLTPKQFFLYRRIEKSKKMLQQDYQILDVALSCGFYDCPHFYKYFKRYTGVSPLDFQAAFRA